MSLRGFISSSCRGDGGGGGGGGDARVLPHISYINMSTAAMAQPQLVTPPVAQPMFNSPTLSLTIKPKMESFGEIGGLIGENFDPGVMRGVRQDEYEGRSGSDNLEGASDDDHDAVSDKSSRKKKYHRHTPFQIQELESSFKESPHPDEKARLELGKRLGLEVRQVKFWFQNRRTQMKTQLERHENVILKQENDKLRVENITMKEAMRSPICSNCGGPAILGEVSIEENQLKIENARLRDELNRICLLANKLLGRPLSSLPGPMPFTMSNSGLELAVGSSNFGGLNPDNPTLPTGFDFENGISNTLSLVPPARPAIGMTGIGATFDKSLYLELAFAAMDELMRLAQIDNPLWFRSLDGGMDTLNHDEYMRSFPPCVGTKPQGYVSEATKATGLIMINSLALVDTLMDVNHWEGMFSCMIGRVSIIDVISSGMGGTRNGALQLMHSELQVLSPLVPVRQLSYLRFCKQQAEGVWAVVDVSIEAIREGSNGHTFANCRRLPSGCIVQDMPNGYSKVTWIEHSEYDENDIHHLYRPFVRSGMGFGAQRWVVTLQRQYEFLVVMSTVPSEDHAVVSPAGKRSVAKLAQRMTSSFSAGVCATVHKWEVVQVGSVGEGARLMIRKIIGNPGEPPGLVLSATLSVWMPVSSQQLFDFLRNEEQRSQWDILSYEGPMQQMVHIAKGQDRGNSISLLRSSGATTNVNQSSMLILQETSTDPSGSVIVYAAIDIPSMNVVLSGGDSSCVAFLPSGFSIVPDCFPDNTGPSSNNGTSTKDDSAGGAQGSLLTLGFQILVSSLPAANLTVESVDTVNALISRTLQGIKTALQCN